MILRDTLTYTYLGWYMWIFQTEFMHDPAGFDAIWSPVLVENQCLSHSDHASCHRIPHCPVFAGGLPVPRRCCPVSSESGSIFPIPEAEEIPLVGVQLCNIYTTKKKYISKTRSIKRKSNTYKIH